MQSPFPIFHSLHPHSHSSQVQQKRWKVETYSRLDSVLQLSSVNLPGGVLRRRGIQDELMMRDYFREGDLISVRYTATSHTSIAYSVSFIFFLV